MPPNATVVFEVEVLSVSKGPRTMEAFGRMDLDKDKSLSKAEVTLFYNLVITIEARTHAHAFYHKISPL